MDKQPAVYIMASKRNGTLYIGVTFDLVKRVWEHKNDIIEGFTKRYGVHQLVWYEIHESMESAITREKRLKEWKRKWKLELIEKDNPSWEDLFEKKRGQGLTVIRFFVAQQTPFSKNLIVVKS